MFQTMQIMGWNMTRMSDHVPDIVGTIPNITGPILDISGTIPDISGTIPDIVTKISSHVPDIRLRCLESDQGSCSYPGHQIAMSGM